jgi:hypothetical protein
LRICGLKTPRKTEAKQFERRAEAILRNAARPNPGRHTVDVSDLVRAPRVVERPITRETSGNP